MSSSSNTTNNNNQNKNINPRPCVYGCGIQIYWNTSVNEYWEAFTKKKHICPNRGNKSSGTITSTTITKDGGITPLSTAQNLVISIPLLENNTICLYFCKSTTI
jgi:hypothetical protein